RHGHARDQRERERAVDEDLAELRALRVWAVEVDRVRVVRQAGEEQVVVLADRPAEPAAEGVTRLEVLVEAAFPDLLRRLHVAAHARSFRRLPPLCQTFGWWSNRLPPPGFAPRLTPGRKSDIKAPDPIVDSGGRAVKGVLFHEFGGLDVLQVEEVDDPQPGAGEVLIEITA